jgi:hypothetical protein
MGLLGNDNDKAAVIEKSGLGIGILLSLNSILLNILLLDGHLYGTSGECFMQ